MKRNRRNGVILPALAGVMVLVQLAALLVSGRFVAGAWATHERASAERAARSAGLPLTPAAFAAKYPKPAEADNLADDLVMTAAAMRTALPAWQAFDLLEDDGRLTRQDGELPPADVVDVYRKAAASQRSALAVLNNFDQQLDPLTGRPAGDWPFIQPDGDDSILARRLPWLGGQRDLASLLRLRAMAQTADGDAAGALRAIRQGLGQARVTADSDYLTSVLTSLGINGSANDALDVLAANLRPDQIGDGPRQISRGDLRAMIALLLDGEPIRTSLARGLAGDVIMSLDTIDNAVDTDDVLRSLARTTDAGPFAPLQRRFAAESFAWLLQPLIDREAAAYLRFVTKAAGALDAADEPEWVARAPSDADYRAAENRFAPLPLAKYLVPSVDRAGRACLWRIADHHRAAAALAVRLYAADHGGDLPPTLAALVPDYLPAVPRDATAADAVIGYDPARRRLWTAGLDGDDDNGVSEADLLRDDPTQSNRDLRGRFDDVLVLR